MHHCIILIQRGNDASRRRSLAARPVSCIENVPCTVMASGLPSLSERTKYTQLASTGFRDIQVPLLEYDGFYKSPFRSQDHCVISGIRILSCLSCLALYNLFARPSFGTLLCFQFLAKNPAQKGVRSNRIPRANSPAASETSGCTQTDHGV